VYSEAQPKAVKSIPVRWRTWVPIGATPSTVFMNKNVDDDWEPADIIVTAPPSAMPVGDVHLVENPSGVGLEIIGEQRSGTRGVQQQIRLTFDDRYTTGSVEAVRIAWPGIEEVATIAIR